MVKRSKSGWVKTIALIAAIVLLLAVIGLRLFGCSIFAEPTPSVENGLLAYELTTQCGYKGSILEWLTALSGKSTYELAVENGFSGAEDEWLEALKATSVQDTAGIKAAHFSAAGNLLITLTDGTVINVGRAIGVSDKDSADSVGVKSAGIDENGQLAISFTNGKVYNLGKIVGTNGGDDLSAGGSAVTASVGIKVITISESGNLTIELTDSAVNDLGNIKGAGGVGIARAEINAHGELVITYTDGTSASIGKEGSENEEPSTPGLPSADGKIPEIGEDGNLMIGGVDTGIKATGIEGKDDIGISNVYVNDAGHLIVVLTDTRELDVGYAGDSSSSGGSSGGAASEPTGPALVVGNAAGSSGETVQVAISLINNPGVAFMRMTATYDESVLTLTNIEFKMEGSGTQPPSYSSPVILNWYNSSNNITSDADFVVLTFIINDAVASGAVSDISLQFNPVEITDIYEAQVAMSTINGSVTVK